MGWLCRPTDRSEEPLPSDVVCPPPPPPDNPPRDKPTRTTQGTKSQAATTIVLRGANDYMLDEMDRALHDSLMVIKRMLESNALVAGGGAVEAALSIHLEKYATTLGSKEQLAIAEFADALLVIPRTLSVNAAQVGRMCVCAWAWVYCGRSLSWEECMASSM